MKESTKVLSKSNTALRKKAVLMLDNNEDEFAELSPFEIRELIQELHIHQIELEMQNEELIKSQVDLELYPVRTYETELS
ncbi:MAG TPA: hypothetical protein EYQ42_09995 [Thiotrichaceae bacterium]|jgi:hypothetical protein|nr:hypothetical protein [Thiotrichaceae bacterium]HIM09065.1 hypothetical protein [Gammaproteobacteria bacterium]